MARNAQSEPGVDETGLGAGHIISNKNCIPK